jgi:hypothetical protein
MNILTHSGPFALFFAFAIAHALADFPLQGDYLARTKRRDQAGNLSEWLISLTAHSLVQAGGVWIVSGSALLGATELCLHWLIDLGKGEGKFGYVVDQLFHLGCKLAYVILLVLGMVSV